MGCGAALAWTGCGALLLAWSTCENNRSHFWFFFSLGPFGPSCCRVLSVPYHATSMIPGALPAATHGKTFTLAGGLLICRGGTSSSTRCSLPAAPTSTRSGRSCPRPTGVQVARAVLRQHREQRLRVADELRRD